MNCFNAGFSLQQLQGLKSLEIILCLYDEEGHSNEETGYIPASFSDSLFNVGIVSLSFHQMKGFKDKGFIISRKNFPNLRSLSLRLSSRIPLQGPLQLKNLSIQSGAENNQQYEDNQELDNEVSEWIESAGPNLQFLNLDGSGANNPSRFDLVPIIQAASVFNYDTSQ